MCMPQSAEERAEGKAGMVVPKLRAWMLAAALLPAAAHCWLVPAAMPEELPPPVTQPVVSLPDDVCIVGPHGPRQDGQLEPYAGMVPDRSVAALGVASCATVSCHGGPLSGNRDVQSFAATIWASHDRHARAYEVLHSERSQRMARLLGIGPPHRAQQCLVCHSVQDMAPTRLPQEVLADGVGCAACHGDATHWQPVHMLPEWKTLPRESRVKLGYRDLSTPLDRVQTCVRCHVGDAQHEVNHDLIAAGHPRLFFEFAAYQRLEPRHWSPQGKAEASADFTARSWSVGQAATLAAVADLLATRAERAHDAVGSGNAHRWPEFAEFDCYSCHRTLGTDTNAASREPALRRPRPGQPSWQPWQVAGARLLRAGMEGGTPIAGTAATDLERSAVDIQTLLDTQWAAADRERLSRVLMEARGLAVAARRNAADINGRTLIAVDASDATLDAITATHPADWETWDAAVQTYLAMEAGRQGGPATIGVWRSGHQPAVVVSTSASRRSLDDLRASLRFPPAADTPGPFDHRNFQRARRGVP